MGGIILTITGSDGTGGSGVQADVRFINACAYLKQLPAYYAEGGSRSPKAIIDSHIVAEIRTLLTTTDISLKEVAQRVGFQSQAQLSRFFRKHEGASPTEYRLKNKDQI